MKKMLTLVLWAVFVVAVASWGMLSAFSVVQKAEELSAKRVSTSAMAGGEKNDSEICASDSDGEERGVLILMYHQFLNTRTSKYIVKPETLRHDLQSLKKHGYESVRTAQLVDFVDNKGKLPKKPVLITFDDGHYSNLFYAEQILKEEGFTAVESIVGKFTENTVKTNSGKNPNYSHLMWDDIKEMAEGGVFEIGNHSFNMHNFTPRFGIEQKSGEDDETYRQALKNDVQKLQTSLKEKSGVVPTVFAFPFGKYNTTAKETLDELGFRVMLTCNEGISKIEVGKRRSLWQLKRYNRSEDIDMEKFLTEKDGKF